MVHLAGCPRTFARRIDEIPQKLVRKQGVSRPTQFERPGMRVPPALGYAGFPARLEGF